MGNHLFNEVVKLTGLPQSILKKELRRMLKKKGFNSKRLTLKELRLFTASLLQETMFEKASTSERVLKLS